MKKRTYIYALHDPRDWSIRYVGKANIPDFRHGRKRSHNRLLQNFLSELRALGMKPRVSILQKCSQDQWQNWERFWIATVKASGEKLLNLHSGGEGQQGVPAWNKGKKLSEEYRKKLSEAHKGTLSRDRAIEIASKSSGHTKPHSLEAKEKMRAAKLGKKQSLKHRANVSKALHAAWKNPETRNRIMSGHRKKISKAEVCHR